MSKNWDEVRILHHGDEYFAEAIACIRQAKTKIALESYIFELDPISDKILIELQLAAWRGCQVRLLVDGVGSFFSIDALKKRCLRDKIEFRVYHPVPGAIQWITRLALAMTSRPRRLLSHTNRRNHRKSLIIDDHLALLGSFNITRLHSETSMGSRAWRDSGVRIRGPAVSSLRAAFDLSWKFSKNIRPLTFETDWAKQKLQTILQSQDLLRLNANNRIRRFLYKDLCYRVRHAQKKVYIANAYFLPKRALLTALAKAAKRGVDVRIITPGPTDLPIVKWAASQIAFKLHQVGVKMFEFQPRIFHAKYMIIDDWSSIGSFNLNHRSLLHDLEVEVVLRDDQSLSNLNHKFIDDLLLSKPFDAGVYKQSPWWLRLISKTLFKLRYWF